MATANKPEIVKAPSLDDHAGEDEKAQTATFDYMKAYFAAQPKVSVKCQEDQWVQVNGYTFIIKGGERVQVPQGVADILEESGRI
jgi:hypothetical protein